MELSSDYDGAQKAVSAALVSTTRIATRIAAEDIAFHRSSNPTAARAIDERSARLLSIAEKLLLRSAFSESASRPRLRSSDAVDTNWNAIVDGVDSLLERADIALDEYAGYFRKRNDDSREQSPAPKKSKFLPREFRNQNFAKPQLLFEHAPFNHETKPFKPFLSAKPHAQVPLDIALDVASQDGHEHPYSVEIKTYQYPSFVHITAPPIDAKPFDSTKAIFVDDMAGVHSMLADLKTAKEIAIDLEHHDAHSYIGIVSLMQISTRHQDWIVDTLKPWRRQLELLNEVFADPRIVKVLHGAQMDVLWLQRDLGLYLVGLFDTYHASRALGYTGHGLAFLLKKFVSFDAQKQYQTADWRIRPLPTELFDYARSDTHFLLFIYDHMRNELIEKSHPKHDKLQDVLDNSKEYALQRYEHPFYCKLPRKSANGWFNMLCKTPTSFTDPQLAVFRTVHEWRDAVGREEDESPNHVLTNHALQNIARAMPRDKPSLLAIAGHSSPIARVRVDELLSIVSDAQADPGPGEEIRAALGSASSSWLPFNVSAVDTPQSSETVQSSIVATTKQPARIEASNFWGSVLRPGSHAESSPLPDLFGLTLSRASHTLDLTDVPCESTDTHTERRESTKRKLLDTAVSSDLGTSKLNQKGVNGSTHDEHGDENDTSFTVQRKAERKALKKRIKLMNKESRPDVEAEAFDYDGTTSVLQDAHRGPRREKKSQKATFNPYAKAAEAPSGLGRAQNFRAGRTTTFK